MIIKTTNMVGIIVPDASNSFYSSIIKGAYDLLKNAGYDILIGNNYNGADKENDVARSMLQRKVDGILFISPNQLPGEYAETPPQQQNCWGNIFARKPSSP